MLSRREVDGLIFLGHHLPDSLGPLLSREGAGAPIVNGCEYSPDLGVPSVHIDNAAASGDAIDHLIALGHRSIGVVTGPEISPISRDRLAGAIAAADRAGLRDSLHIAVGDYSAGSAVDPTRDLLARSVTAIFCFSDEMAMGTLSAIRDAGLSCPADMSVIGFDDLPLARYFQPPLTTIAQPKGMIGRRTVELLVDILRGGDSTARQVTLDHALIVRASTAAPRR